MGSIPQSLSISLRDTVCSKRTCSIERGKSVFFLLVFIQLRALASSDTKSSMLRTCNHGKVSQKEKVFSQ